MVELKKGVKIAEDEEKSLDPRKKVVVKDAEVEGQYWGDGSPEGYRRVECPWCGQRGTVKNDTDAPYQYFGCGSCGRAFRA